MRFQFEDEVFLQPIAADEIVFNILFAPAGKQITGVVQGRERHSVRAVICWWGKAADETARKDARPTIGGQRTARSTEF